VFEVNRREITYLLYSPSEIIYKFNLVGALKRQFFIKRQESLISSLSLDSLDIFLNDETYYNLVIDFMI
jgi:hypothetical protein